MMTSRLDSSEAILDYSKLYEVGDAFIRGSFRARPQIEVDALALARGEHLPQRPVVFQHFMGIRPRDVVGTGFAALELFSDIVIHILQETKTTGWTTYPIELYDKVGKRIYGFNGFSVTGRCGPIDWTMGKKVRRPAPVSNGQPYNSWIGMYFDPKTWDGSDVFMPEGTTYKIITEPVMLALKRAKVSNIEFTRLTEFERTWREPCDDD